MSHWIIDREADALPSWLAAMPEAAILRRDQIGAIPVGEPGILWCRVRAEEAAHTVLQLLQPGAGQFVIVLADDPDESVVSESLAAGAAGCCNTHAAPEVLRQVALVVENGGLWIGQHLLQKLVGRTSQVLAQRTASQRNDDWLAQLSDREAQVARLVANGASNREIAGQLFITERTVKAHLTAIFEKLALRDRLQLSLRINGLSV